ncbi:hypothetical protein LJR029_000888 [Caballeronia sp. LjRoot29]|uniref:hypothetical protein n=1 Tax=unclassified Caballeronia TaxID=2646786 RepID=UPI003ECE9C79
MNIGEQSLRLLVEKWFAPTAETPVRITRFGRTHANQERCIRVETLRTEGAVAIFFFRHDDGIWCVFPPKVRCQTMRAYESAL